MPPPVPTPRAAPSRSVTSATLGVRRESRWRNPARAATMGPMSTGGSADVSVDL